MPLAFPSHQGLILPLWRRCPRRIDALALCVGAALPDIADAIAWPFRGDLGQWLGHSLLGVVLSAPLGLALTRLVRSVLERRSPGRRWLARLDEGAPRPAGAARETLSVALGALSHLASDLITHGNFVLLWPWYRNDRAFPSWWYHSWGGIPLPLYRDPYPLAPHTIVWVVVSIVGAVLFVRCLRPTGGARSVAP